MPNTCPTCGGTMPDNVYWCYACNRRVAGADSSQSWIIGGLMISGIGFLLSASHASSLLKPGADRYGDLPFAAIRTGILLLLIVWLASSLALRSQAPAWKKAEAARASLNIFLGVAAICLGLTKLSEIATNNAEFIGWPPIAALWMSGVLILVLGLRTVAKDSPRR